MSKVNFNKSALQAYQDTGLLDSLFPVCKWDAFRMEKEERIALGKTPLSKGWSKEQQLSMESILAHIEKGGNLGFRIPKDWIVIDLDPRNYASTAEAGETEDSVAEVLGLLDWDDIEFDYNVVRTGGGGYHIYCQLPDQEIYKRVRTKLKGLQGVDFKRHGGYVIAAGSRHPNGRHYEWINPLSPETAYQFDDATLKPLLRAPVESSNDASYGALNGMELQSAFLSKAKASWFPDNDSWFPIMCACHFVTAGSAADEFVEWSTSDPDYAKEGEQIRYRWDSLDDRRGDANTVGTLIYKLKEHGEEFGELMDLLGKNDFADLCNEEEDEEGFLQKASDATSDLMLDELINEDSGMTDAYTYIASLPEESERITAKQMEKAVRLITNEDMLTAIRAGKMLMEKAGISKSEYNQIAKQAKQKQSEDIPVMIRDKMFEAVFNNGRHIRFVHDTFYIYRTTHWVETIPEFIGRLAERTLNSIKEKIDIPMGDSAVIQSCLSMARYARAQVDASSLSAEPRPIINCLDCELHLKSDGSVERQPHSYKSNQNSVLNIKYGDYPFDASTEEMSPLFHQTLREIFAEFDDGADIIRHLGELLGYMIQPNKNIASTWLFKGPGGDGKSTLLKIIKALMGRSFWSANQEILGRKDPHAAETFPGKLVIAVEELSDSIRLNEVAIKELSESHEMEANPKGRKKFTFAFSGTLVMCANSWPRIGDVTIGMRDRLNVIPFNRRFRVSGTADRDRAKRITDSPVEMAGVLRWALQGLSRLRKRGDFLQPLSCKIYKNEWLRESNSTIRYFQDCLERDSETYEKPLCTAAELHKHYEQWSSAEGNDARYLLTKQRLVIALQKLGVDIHESQHGDHVKKLRVFGVKYREGKAMEDLNQAEFSDFV